MTWREGIMRMLRLRRPDVEQLEDEQYEREKLRRAKIRLAYLDHQAEVILRRSTTHKS